MIDTVTLERLSEDYAKFRHIAASSQVDFEILLTSRMPHFRKERSTIGYDMACLRLVEESPEAAELYRKWKETEGRYKGLERILDANAAIMSYEQSKMRYAAQGEQRGF